MSISPALTLSGLAWSLSLISFAMPRCDFYQRSLESLSALLHTLIATRVPIDVCAIWSGQIAVGKGFSSKSPVLVHTAHPLRQFGTFYTDTAGSVIFFSIEALPRPPKQANFDSSLQSLILTVLYRVTILSFFSSFCLRILAACRQHFSAARYSLSCMAAPFIARHTLFWKLVLRSNN